MNQTLHRVLCRITDLRRAPAEQLKPGDILDCLEWAVMKLGRIEDNPANTHGGIPKTIDDILRIL